MTLDFDRLREALERWDSFVEPLADYEQSVVGAARLLLGAEKRWECVSSWGERWPSFDTAPTFCRWTSDKSHLPDCGWRLSVPWPTEET